MLVKAWSNPGQSLVKVGQSLVKAWSKPGQSLVKAWSKPGRILVKAKHAAALVKAKEAGRAGHVACPFPCRLSSRASESNGSDGLVKQAGHAGQTGWARWSNRPLNLVKQTI
jgi:hypothetical protein